MAPEGGPALAMTVQADTLIATAFQADGCGRE